MTTLDGITVERWMFAALIGVLGMLCLRELNRLSTSIDNLTQAQQAQLSLYQDLKADLREFHAVYALDKLRWDAKQK